MSCCGNGHEELAKVDWLKVWRDWWVADAPEVDMGIPISELTKPVKGGERGIAMTAQQHCCESMKRAHQPGTDNEGYEQLAWSEGGKVTIGFGLPPISFCPWCGAKSE